MKIPTHPIDRYNLAHNQAVEMAHEALDDLGHNRLGLVERLAVFEDDDDFEEFVTEVETEIALLRDGLN